MDDSLDGISGAVLVNATGPGKVRMFQICGLWKDRKLCFQTLFKPDNVMFLSTHWVLSHSRYGLKRKKVSSYSLIRGESNFALVQIPREEALLLHNRVRFRGDQLKDAIEEELT